MVPVCCPRCRLLQCAGQHAGRYAEPFDRRCGGRYDGRYDGKCIDCGESTAALGELTRLRIAGVSRETRRPPDGWRDRVALYTTAAAVFAAGTAGVLVCGSAAGALFGPAVGALGYSKQFWRAVIIRRPRLAGAAPRERPDGAPLIGVAQSFERTVAGGALAVATVIANRDGVIVRAVDAVPFWLVIAGRRVLVTGPCWVSGAVHARPAPVGDVLRELDASELPIARARRAELTVWQTAVVPGERIAVFGRVREGQLAGSGGYRDAVGELIRGEPGAVVWIERLERLARATPVPGVP